MSSSTSDAYLGLSRAQEYTLKPAYIAGKGFIQLEAEHFGLRDSTKALNDLTSTVYLSLLFKRMISKFRGHKTPTVIVYASVTGNAAKYASDLGSILRTSCNVSFFDACGANAAEDSDIHSLIKSSTMTIFVTSTQGNGELPSLSTKFFSLLFDEHPHLLRRKKCAVLGFGSSAYPIFCGAAAYLSKKLAEAEAKEVIHRGQCDAVKGESQEFYKWTSNLVAKMATMPDASPLMAKLSMSINENTKSVLAKRRDMMHSVEVEVFTADEVKSAAASSYMTRRGSGGASKYRRRHSVCTLATQKDTRLVNRSVSLPVTESETDSDSLGTVEREDIRRSNLLIKIISSSDSGHHDISREKNLLPGHVISREDLISNDSSLEDDDKVSRKTSLVKIDLSSCGGKCSHRCARLTISVSNSL